MTKDMISKLLKIQPCRDFEIVIYAIRNRSLTKAAIRFRISSHAMHAIFHKRVRKAISYFEEYDIVTPLGKYRRNWNAKTIFRFQAFWIKYLRLIEAKSKILFNPTAKDMLELGLKRDTVEDILNHKISMTWGDE